MRLCHWTLVNPGYLARNGPRLCDCVRRVTVTDVSVRQSFCCAGERLDFHLAGLFRPIVSIP